MGPARDGDASVPEGSGRASYDWDLVTDALRWTTSVAELVGLDEECLATGLGWAEHLVAESPSSRYEAVMAGGTDTGDGVVFRVVYGLRPARRSDVAPVWIEDEGRWFADSADRPVRVRGNIRLTSDPFDADEAGAANQRDPATGAFTRDRFIGHATRQLRLAGTRIPGFAVLAIAIEPSFGALSDDAADDAAMAEAFARLRPEMRFDEMVARTDARRFAVLIETSTAEQTTAAAHRFITAIESGTPALRARISAVQTLSQARSAEALLQAADEPLEGARGAPAFVLNDREAARNASPRDDVLSALNDGRVLLALRPVVAAPTRQAVLHEAQVRVVTSDGCLIAADDLERQAAEDGLDALLARRVLELAVGLLAGDRRLKLSIGVSLATLGEEVWLEHLRATAKLRPDVTRRLILEIAERHALADMEVTCATLDAVRPCGVKLALVGFGQARASFRTLRRLAADFLEIDGALTRDPDIKSIGGGIRDVVDLARNLSVPTIARVAGEAEAQALMRLGVDHLKGDMFAQLGAEAAPSAFAPSASAPGTLARARA